jgi:hypothetical protein
METLIIISVIYTIGFWIALAISAHYIDKYKTKDNPMIGAMFSWVTVLIVLIVFLIFTLISILNYFKVLFKK